MRQLGIQLAAHDDGAAELLMGPELFDLVEEHLVDVTTISSADGVYTYVSRAASVMLGWEPSELAGRPSDEFVHPEDLAEVRTGRAAALASPPVVITTQRLRGKDGGYRWTEHATRQVDDPRLPGELSLLSSTRDLAERKLSVESDAVRADLVLSAIPYCVALCVPVHDQAGRIVDFICTYGNPAARDEFGRQGEGIVGRTMFHLDAGLLLSSVFSVFAAVAETGVPFADPAFVYRDATVVDLCVVTLQQGILAAWHCVSGEPRPNERQRSRQPPQPR
jgi:PAS domain S-box-containing protein